MRSWRDRWLRVVMAVGAAIWLTGIVMLFVWELAPLGIAGIVIGYAGYAILARPAEVLRQREVRQRWLARRNRGA